MDFRKERFSAREARQIDIVDYLARLGFNPVKIKNFDYWYLSPFRVEKTASFKVNRKLNRWYDHGLGKGGNIIDFAIQYKDCTVGEFLQQINSYFSFQKPFIVTNQQDDEVQESKIKILSIRPLSAYRLINYLKSRRISIALADQYCKEITYQLNNRLYYAVGFQNDSGGYELRNPYFKGSSSPKDIRTIKNDSNEVAVFEGVMDFLSFLVIYKNQSKNRMDYVILNSVAFFEKARFFMEQHKVIRLYLDRDPAGQNCSLHALSLDDRYIDESELYRRYKDLNDWLINLGKSQKGIQA